MDDLMPAEEAQTHRVFPPAVQFMLKRAASTPIPVGAPIVRIIAVNEAIERVKRQFPELFRSDV